MMQSHTGTSMADALPAFLATAGGVARDRLGAWPPSAGA
jgi:hypothetical protein